MPSTMLVKLLVVIATFISPLLAQMDDQFLADDILKRCYKHPVYEDGRLYVNGQENPLASSLDNFINLVEKFELANPDFDLKDELLILLENYTTENVEYTSIQGIAQLDVVNPPKGMEKHDIDKIMGTGISQENIRYPHNDPFDDNEKCSLYFMLTRSINSTAIPGIDSIETSPDSKPDELKNRYYPREQGVVSIYNSSVQSVALGRVIKGLFLGLNGGSQKKLNEVKNEFQIKLDLTRLGTIGEETVLPLYLTTLADQLVLANSENIDDSSKVLRKNGKWKSVQKPVVGTNTDELDNICPTTYVLPSDSDTGSRYTYSSVRGGIDGLILGNIISSIEKSDPSIKLSKILRMYYSPSGITENTSAPRLNGKATFCKRLSAIDNLIETLKTQLKLYYIISAKSLSEGGVNTKAMGSWKLYDDNRNDILDLDKELDEICEENIDKVDFDTYPIETSSDIVVVMDTTENKDTFEKQQLIIGHLANKLDIRYNGSSLTVFLDRKNDTSGNSLNNILPQAFSSACSACSINHYQLPGGISGETEKEYTIDSITKILYEMKRNEDTLGGAKGKIVIYFDFGAEEKQQSKPRRALKDFYKQHRDVQVFAVGNNKDVMKLYTQNNEHNTVPVPNNSPSEVADILAKKIKEVPARLQYKDCNKTRSGKSDLFEGLITPGARQRWSMSADYFYKSYVSKVIFEAKKGDITVCHNRARPNTEMNENSCKHTSPSERSLEFINSNPCQGFEKETCSQMFFTVIGKLPSDDTDTESNSGSQNDYCKDTKDAICKTQNQIPFTVKQDGIRCSGCGKILSSPLMLLAVCVITYFKFSS